MRIFISYSWKDKETANQLETALISSEIEVIRDIRDLKFKESIKAFMKRVRQTDLVLMIISDSFLKSENCMFEVLEFIKDENYKDRILPLVSDSVSIFSSNDKINYLGWWKTQYENLENDKKKFEEIHTIPIAEHLKFINNIQREIVEFLTVISDMQIIIYKKAISSNIITQILDYINLPIKIGFKYVLDLRSPNVYALTAGESIKTLEELFDNEIELELFCKTRYGNMYLIDSSIQLKTEDFEKKLKKKYPKYVIDFIHLYLESDSYYICCKRRTIFHTEFVWWEHFQYGYTSYLSEAGLYSKEVALELVNRANINSQLAIPKTLIDKKFRLKVVPFNKKNLQLLSKEKEFLIGNLLWDEEVID